MPTYDWLKGSSVDGLSGDMIKDQYREYCAKRNIPFTDDIFYENTAFEYIAPPENRSLA
jgi:hypothetical protein